MTSFELYTLFLCLFVYVLFVALFSTLIGLLLRASLRAIREGLEDERIKRDYEKTKLKKRGCFCEGSCKILPLLCCLIVTVVFVLATVASITSSHKVGALPTVRVVSSASMSKKDEKNEYLFENNLDNQMQVFDLVLLHQLPPENELKLYDIVVYEVDDTLLIHRIVGIEEPNAEHPNERQFLLQGDNVQFPDKFPVLYSQMMSIYRDQRIPNIGSFVFFMQSPAGTFCFLLTVMGVFAMFIIEKKLLAAIEERLLLIQEEELLAYAKAKGRGVLLSDTDRKRKTPEDEEGKESVRSDVLPFPMGEVPPVHVRDLYFGRIDNTETLSSTVPLTEGMPPLPVGVGYMPAWTVRLEKVIAELISIKGISCVRRKRDMIYKRDGAPLARIYVDAENVFVYLAADTDRYANAAKGAISVAGIKEFAAYPLRIALTSDESVDYIKTILSDMFPVWRR